MERSWVSIRLRGQQLGPGRQRLGNKKPNLQLSTVVRCGRSRAPQGDGLQRKLPRALHGGPGINRPKVRSGARGRRPRNANEGPRTVHRLAQPGQFRGQGVPSRGGVVRSLLGLDGVAGGTDEPKVRFPRAREAREASMRLAERSRREIQRAKLGPAFHPWRAREPGPPHRLEARAMGEGGRGKDGGPGGGTTAAPF